MVVNASVIDIDDLDSVSHWQHVERRGTSEERHRPTTSSTLPFTWKATPPRPVKNFPTVRVNVRPPPHLAREGAMSGTTVIRIQESDRDYDIPYSDNQRYNTLSHSEPRRLAPPSPLRRAKDVVEPVVVHKNWSVVDTPRRSRRTDLEVKADEMKMEISRIHQTLVETETRTLERSRKQEKRQDTMSLGSSRRTSDDHSSVGSDSSTIMSMQDQIVKYTANSSDYSDDNTAERYQNLVVRLERELTEAQNCNHRLNQQLKTLANSSQTTVKNELATAKKELKEKNSELDKLRKALTKADSERSTWLSKQPNDVQMLMAEKKELRKQLDREQNEKHQLFMEMNSMVAQLAEQADPDEVKKLKSENSALQSQLDSIKVNSIAENGKTSIELKKTKEDMEALIRKTEDEKRLLQSQIEDKQRQLDIKTASLQSLQLAKQDTGVIDKLREENEKLSEQVDSLNRKLEESKRSITELQFGSETAALRETKLKEVEAKLQEVMLNFTEERNKNESLKNRSDELKTHLQASEESLSRLKSKISQFEGDVVQLQKENEDLLATKKSLNGRMVELESEVEGFRSKNDVLEATLKEKDDKIDKTKVALLAAESRAVQAEEDLKEVTNKALSAERREQQLKAQIDAQGNSNAQLDLLKKDLDVSEQKNSFLTSKLGQLESVLQKKTTELSNVSEELEEAMKKIDSLESSKPSENIITELEGNLKKAKSECKEITEKLKRVEESLTEAESENKRLEAKAAVADELTTLMTSLNSVRQENSEYIEELERQEKEIRELRDELYQEQEVCLQWKNKAHEAEIEKKSAVEKMQILESTRDRADSNLQEEKASFEEMIKNQKEELSRIQTELGEQIRQLQEEKTSTVQASSKKITELEEKCRKAESEAGILKARVESLQDEALKSIGSADEQKQSLVKQIQKLENDMQTVTINFNDVTEQKNKLEKGAQELREEVDQLQKRNEKVEKDKEELVEEIKSIQDQLFRTNDGVKEVKELKNQLESLKQEYKESIEKLIEKHNDELEKLGENIEKEKNEKQALDEALERGKSSIQSTELEVQQLRQMVQKLEDEKEVIRKGSVSSEKEHDTAKARLAALEEKLSEVSTSKAALLQQIQEQTKLLESEANRVRELADEKSQLQSKCEQLQVELDEKSNGVVSEKESELVAENARLAGELLKAHSSAERTMSSEREQVARQFEEKVRTANSERMKLASELQATTSKVKILEATIEEQKTLIQSTEKKRRDDLLEMEELRNEKHQLRTELQKLQNGPVAPPRAATRTISNMSAMTTLTQNDFSECEDLVKLRGEIDKQKRLIVVLRRKLQAALKSH